MDASQGAARLRREAGRARRHLHPGNLKLVANIRALSNAARVGKTVFEEFWCVYEELDSMNTAAESATAVWSPLLR